MIYTTEISEPDHEGLQHLCLSSDLIKGRLDVSVWIPEGINSLPMVTLLHGVYGSHWCWSKLGKAHVTARDLMSKEKISPMLLVMPSDGLQGDGSGYLDGLDECLSLELPRVLSEKLGLDITHQYISGLSMGGWGAMRLGFKYSDVYSGISAHSSITNAEDFSKFSQQGFPFDLSKIDPLIDLVQPIPLRFDCGKDDLLIESNRTFHRQLLSKMIPHEYDEYEGGHEWCYWQEHLVESLEFFNSL